MACSLQSMKSRLPVRLCRRCITLLESLVASPKSCTFWTLVLVLAVASSTLRLHHRFVRSKWCCLSPHFSMSTFQTLFRRKCVVQLANLMRTYTLLFEMHWHMLSKFTVYTRTPSLCWKELKRHSLNRAHTKQLQNLRWDETSEKQETKPHSLSILTRVHIRYISMRGKVEII